MSNQTEVFNLKGDWYCIVDGVMVPATFNSRGAALAAIEVERKRRKKKKEGLTNAKSVNC
jgi:hypothetical protein